MICEDVEVRCDAEASVAYELEPRTTEVIEISFLLTVGTLSSNSI